MILLSSPTPTPRGAKNKNNHNKCPQVELEEDKADPAEPAKKAFKNAPGGSSLLEGLTIPSGVDISTTVKLSLSCLNEAEDGSFRLSSPKGSSKAKGGPGGAKVKEENLEKEDEQNPDEGPDDTEDIKVDEVDDWDDPKSKPGQKIGSASIVKKEGNNGNGEPKREKSFSELVRECHYKKFLLHTEEANLMKCALLGLEDVLILTQEQVDQSRLFEERPSNSTAAIEDVSEYWLPILDEKFMLTEKVPSDVTPKEGHTLLYTYESLLKLHPYAAEAWAKGTLKPAFVAVMLTLTPFTLQQGISLEHFHTVDALQKVTISKWEESKKTNTQYAYCGVRIENSKTCVNHIRKHLPLHLLCGGCYAFHSDTFKPMLTHMHRCLGVKNVKALQAEKDKEEAKGSQTGTGKSRKKHSR